jgi:branched-chain amino acid transport system substrate-binding protein
MAGVVAIIILACSPPEPIRIGFIAGISGRVADLGSVGRDAVQLAIEQCNQKGGIRGRTVQLIIKDDRQDPDVARQAVRELAADGVVAIVGPMTSSMAVAVVPVLNEVRIPNMSPTVTTRELSGRDDFFLRVSATTLDNASKRAAFHAKPGGMRRVAAAYDLGNRSYCESWLENFSITFKSRGGAVVAAIGFETGRGRAFLDIARDLLASEPDGVLIIANSMDSALLCQQIRKLNAAVSITLADWGATERLMELGGNAVEGVTVIQVFDRNSTASAYLAFRKAYVTRYKREPGFPGVFSYDAIQVVLTALRAQEGGQPLKKTILALGRFKGLQEDFSFDEFGDVKRSNVSISVVRNQQFVVVE